ncbi:DUF3800 domain-containing protein [Pseudomonas sp. 2822-17]|uniref:DUF3800 domain-containing protein n=1 Tax=Pseudomonas sp. 2822-17 TaxID=1712678 RepID=UPI00117A8C38|nr:DUF3800 domain-containing protein [Pseudomonas sp. 2822-17]
MENLESAVPMYDSVNHLVRDLKLDRNSWINKEAIRFLKKTEYDKCEVRLKHVPEEWLAINFHCDQGHDFSVDWLAKTPPSSVFEVEGGLLRQATYGTFCTVCGAPYQMPIHNAKYVRDADIFGDEAFRFVDGKSIFCYTFVGFVGAQKSEKKFKREYSKIKARLAPAVCPDEWVLHVTELLSSDKRRKNKYLSHLNGDQALKGLREIARLIGKFSSLSHLNVYNAVSILLGDAKGRGKASVLDSVYSSVLMRVVSEYTASGVAPKFYFERTGADGWAKNLFDGGRLTLLWTRIANGLPVMSPVFVPPSHSFYLEIADVVSFLVARYLYCVGSRAEGRMVESDIDPSLLGKLRYVWTDGDGHWNLSHTTGFPSKRMFKGTSWEDYI